MESIVNKRLLWSYEGHKHLVKLDLEGYLVVGPEKTEPTPEKPTDGKWWHKWLRQFQRS